MADEDATNFIQLRQPTQCVMWERPELALEKFSKTFEIVEKYEEESHLSHSLWKCRECGQLYFHEWYEWVDWEEGQDKTYVHADPRSNSGRNSSAKANDDPHAYELLPTATIGQQKSRLDR